MNITTCGGDETTAYREQFDCTWRDVQGKLRRRARLLCKGDPSRADDLLSDTALKVHLYMQRSPDRVKNLAGFFFLALNHAFLDHARRRGREDRVIEHGAEWEDEQCIAVADRALPIDQQLALKQQLARMEAAVAELAPAQRTLFALKFEDELPYPQIADTLGISEALARKRVELLRKKLRQKLD
ncbi:MULTISPECIES: RNA polymerase sigma factor [Paraburkholderia]|uniref:RNA polymerase RpoE-like sigma-24 subunit n=1 Tax=Paraburkholderia tropica TaxID=92647 RepID=A0A1A5X982_9BURK|nr:MULTISPECIES: sigma-70 family RNA polymerase sigma factor [Paraburkholderia]MBB2978623.1 RNA polymerase sigma-70 factor (ECF subfamily) [Paraburkholderia tropica]MDE1139329.1 sigma-70 family RNA polymerase sigma factor [Paraburkholderia tropica]OBR49745.1 RNA polymerase subunit sigma-24 [Paraburkholderia tropica]PXX19776.1 RNA polymerase RpoE-like sigma-24 subunit [Paraburkholderia tropica]PZW88717.1 RNA polymerase RpoE-like sigma-24 subunit [Paraburkholderia tropica]